MKTIPLTQGKVAFVDDEDYLRLAAHKWYVNRSGIRLWYAVRWNEGSPIRMHREILGLSSGRDPLVDHRNGDGLDNQRANLRVATHSQNLANAGIRTAKLKGAYGRRDKWRSQIRNNGRIVHLGTFNTPKEAHRAYCAAASRIYGEYARYA